MEPKVAREVAEAEFTRLCAARRVDADEAAMDEKDRKDFLETKDAVVKRIMSGELAVEDHGECVYTPPVEGAQPIRFHRTTGAMLMAVDDAPEGKNVAKAAAVMADITKTPRGHLAKMDIADFNFCIKLVTLFLAAGQ